jgi:hypothetical protein
LDHPSRVIGHDRHAPPPRRDALVASAAPCWIIHFTSTGPVRNPWHGMKLFVRQEKLRFPVGFCEVAGYQPGWLSSRIDKIALNSRHLLELPSLPNYDRNGCLRY